jgi:radical SAM protein (TIGR01212 family)
MSMSQVQSTPLRWGDKRYHSWNYHLRQTFGGKVFKVMLDGGFTCPNRDGTVAKGGCTFCSPRGSGDFAGFRGYDLERQFQQVKHRMHTKWPNARYIPYFQAFSGTYAPVEVLRDMYETVLGFEGVVGLAVATRPDCLPSEVLDLLSEVNEKTYLWVELGLQTIHEHTARRINRGHDFACYVEAVEKLRERGIRVCTHIILGLPGETEEEMMQTAAAVARLPVQGIKIHLLHLLKGTPLVEEWRQGGLTLLEQDQYTRLVVDILEILPPAMIVHRLTGDGPPHLLIGPLWSRKKWEVLNGIDAELERRNTWQGKRWTPSRHGVPAGV